MVRTERKMSGHVIIGQIVHLRFNLNEYTAFLSQVRQYSKSCRDEKEDDRPSPVNTRVSPAAKRQKRQNRVR